MTDFLTRPPITSTSSKRIQQLRRLSQRNVRRSLGLTRIEGPQALTEALTYKADALTDVYMTDDAIDRHPQIINLYRANPCFFHTISQAVAHHVAPDAQGIIGVGQIKKLFDTSPVVDICADKKGFAVALIETQDPGNMGNLIRLTDASGGVGVMIAKGSADYASPKVIRMSVGSVFHLPISFYQTFNDMCDDARAKGVALYAADANGDVDLFDADDNLFSRPHAWVMGNEAHGFTNGEQEQCDMVVSIPIYGKAESLNVATAGALCTYESARRQRECR